MEERSFSTFQLSTFYFTWHIFRILIRERIGLTAGPEVSAADSPPPQYSVETLVMAVVAGALAALLVGFVAGYLCGRKCRKDEDDNLPYPDTEYEYFEQRQNVNRYGSKRS